MKKLLFTLTIAIVAINTGYAQFTKDMVAQPTSVIAKKYDASGQVTTEMPSTFTYQDDGKLERYDFPDHSLWSIFFYEDNLLTRELTNHGGGHPEYGEVFDYTYENLKVKTISHLYDAMETNEYWVLHYDEYGRLARKDYKEEYNPDYMRYWIYEYENDGKAKKVSYYNLFTQEGILNQTTYEYDEDYHLLSEYMETYNASGEVSETSQKLYTYTAAGKVESEVSQTLTENGWVNTDIIKYIYDDDRVVERQVGTWAAYNDEWDITNRITYELDEDAMTLTVSFYKKSEDTWVWDYFYDDPLFYEPYLEPIQHAMRFYGWDPMYDNEHINQFVFTLIITERPVYEKVEEQTNQNGFVYPNPTKEMLHLHYSQGMHPKTIELYDLQGRLVRTKATGFESLSMAGLAAGQYVLKVTLENGKVYTDKVVKE